MDSNVISLDDYKRRKREAKKSVAQKIKDALKKFGSHDKKDKE